ncbi:MAG: N-acetylmuramic acid 6-phosphate etherase [bacterium]|nr:N-acetylmuramic acid 6-phosphate etherase [bacterium]
MSDKVILTEQSNSNTVDIDVSSSFEIAKMINNEDKKVALAVDAQLEEISAAIDLISQKILDGGNLLYFGAGTSGRLGVLDASECPPTFGVTSDIVRGYIAGGDKALRSAIEGAEDDYEHGKADLKNSGAIPKDVVVGISASGNPKWLLGVLEDAKAKGISTIGITCNPEAKIEKFSDIFICTVVGQEALTGSSRMKAGSAQKMVLNMLSTGAMIKTGKAYKNFMIDVQPTNEKLKDRAVRIVAEIANVDKNIAKETLEKTNFEVKTAVVMIVLNCSAPIARQKLSEADGVLRKVI